MAKRQPAEPPAEQPKAHWSLGLPGEEPADAAAIEDAAGDTDQPEAPAEKAMTTEDEIAPDREERDELRDRAGSTKGDPT